MFQSQWMAHEENTQLVFLSLFTIDGAGEQQQQLGIDHSNATITKPTPFQYGYPSYYYVVHGVECNIGLDIKVGAQKRLAVNYLPASNQFKAINTMADGRN